MSNNYDVETFKSKNQLKRFDGTIVEDDKNVKESDTCPFLIETSSCVKIPSV